MEFRVPELGEGVYEAELVQWLVSTGESVRCGNALVEVMTDKATIELPATFSGTIDAFLAQAGETIAIGQLLLYYSPHAGEPGPPPLESRESPAPSRSREIDSSARSRRAPLPSATPSDGHGVGSKSVRAAPAVRNMARALGIDLCEVPGSGPQGRVLINDLGTFVRARNLVVAKRGPRSTGANVGEPGQRIRLKGLRRSIAEHMVTAKKTIPHYSYIDECDVSNMVALRNKLKRPLYATGIKLTNLPFYVKAVVGALKQVPLINASLDEEAGEIVLHNQYHIGIATATSKGLVVPVIHDADSKSLAEIAAAIEYLIRAAQAGTIARSDLRGSTFTISSVGNFGGLVSTPIIHHPEVGIVAIGKIFKRPMFDEAGAIVPAQIAYLSFSFDHRVVDGSVGALFANAVIQQLQQPQTLAEGVLP